MSAVDRNGVQQELLQTGPNVFWQTIHRQFAGENPDVWRSLAMFALNEAVGWSPPQIAAAFGTHRGSVARRLKAVKEQLRKKLRRLELQSACADSGFSDPRKDVSPQESGPSRSSE